MALSALSGIVFASLAGGVMSCLFASFSLAMPISMVQRMVALAVGAMLAAVFLDVLPHGLEMAKPDALLMWVLIGLLFFFFMEKLVIWRHSHPGHEHGHAHGHDHHHAHHGHDHAASGEKTSLMVAFGGALHCFCDGILIAGAFLASFPVGVSTAIAIVAHAIPQEIGDFIVLRNAGLSKSRALLVNVGTSLATLVGGVVGYYALSSVRGAIPAALGFAAASMLYIAVSDLIPTLQRRPQVRDILEQAALIAVGVALVMGPKMLLHDH
jgi:zinc and cadmium transporter